HLPGDRRRDLFRFAPVLHRQAAHPRLRRPRGEVQGPLQELRQTLSPSRLRPRAGVLRTPSALRELPRTPIGVRGSLRLERLTWAGPGLAGRGLGGSGSAGASPVVTRPRGDARGPQLTVTETSGEG